jgi:hypothetical protein
MSIILKLPCEFARQLEKVTPQTEIYLRGDAFFGV